jgi:hypothetical protein
MLVNSCVVPELAALQELSSIELINRTYAERSLPAVLLGLISAVLNFLASLPQSLETASVV